MAVGVADEYHGMGMGNILVGALVVAALEMGITHFSAEVLTDNRPMRAILDRLGAEWIEEGSVRPPRRSSSPRRSRCSVRARSAASASWSPPS